MSGTDAAADGTPTLDAQELRRYLTSSSMSHPTGFSGRGATTRLQRALIGDMAAEMRDTIASMAAQRMLRMDEITARLLEHVGVNAAVAAALTLLMGGMSIKRLGLTWAWTGQPSSVRVSGDSWWNPSSSMFALDCRLPETARIVATTRPLRDVMSHPALDDLPLAIQDDGILVTSDTRISVDGVRWLTTELADRL